jgi:hypothetical protein
MLTSSALFILMMAPALLMLMLSLLVAFFEQKTS